MKLYHYEELIQNWPIRSIIANNVGNRLCLQRFIKFIADRELSFRDDENTGSHRNFFQKIFKDFFKKILKKRRCNASCKLFCNCFTNR